MITQDSIYAELGVIVSGRKPGRISDNEITFFDNSGLGVQDAGVALKIYEIAKKRNVGVQRSIVSRSESYPVMQRLRNNPVLKHRD